MPRWTEEPRERFWGKVDVLNDGDCWEWSGGRYRNGYGSFYMNGKDRLAHRVSLVVGQ